MRLTTIEHKAVPTGEYVASVESIDEEQGNFGPQFRWRFSLLKPEEYEDRSLVGWTSTSPSLRSKLVRWASACLGRPIAAGETIDTNDLVGCRVVLVVAAREGSDGVEFSKVDCLRAMKNARSVPPTTHDHEVDEDPFGEE